MTDFTRLRTRAEDLLSLLSIILSRQAPLARLPRPAGLPSAPSR